MTREDRDAEIADQVTYLDLVTRKIFVGRSRASTRFVALGFSQGTTAVCRWAARTDRHPDRIILWGGGVPAELLDGAPRAGLARASLTIVVGMHDPIAGADRVQRHRQELDAARLPYRFVTFDGGHEINGGVLHELANS